MENTYIFADENWLHKNKEIYDLKNYFSNIWFVPYRIKNSNDIDKIARNIIRRSNSKIIIINWKVDYNKEVISAILNNPAENPVVYDPNITKGELDFSVLSSKTIVCFRANKADRTVVKRSFPTIVTFEKFLVSSATNKQTNLVSIVDPKSSKIKEFSLNEDNIIKITRKKRPRRKTKADIYRTPDGRKIYDNTSKLGNVRTVSKNSQKPKVLFLCDVKGWAWWIKSNYIKQYLKNYYDIDIISAIEDKVPRRYDKYDLCLTFGHSYIRSILKAPFERRISGVTAHRPREVIKSKMKDVCWVHANSVLLHNELSDFIKNVFYVPNGVDENLFRPEENLFNHDHDIIIGHIGKMSPRKGQKDYIEPAVNKAGVKYFSHYNNYKSKVKHTEMPKKYRNFDVFICASEEDGTPCPALEAAACGRPIISNRIGNMPELIENYKTGILLDSRNVDDYVDAIKWCRDNPDKVIEMGKNIRSKIESEWTWQLMSKNYLKMFDDILGIKRDLSYYENPALYHIEE